MEQGPGHGYELPPPSLLGYAVSLHTPGYYPGDRVRESLAKVGERKRRVVYKLNKVKISNTGIFYIHLPVLLSHTSYPFHYQASTPVPPTCICWGGTGYSSDAGIPPTGRLKQAGEGEYGR